MAIPIPLKNKHFCIRKELECHQSKFKEITWAIGRWAACSFVLNLTAVWHKAAPKRQMEWQMALTCWMQIWASLKSQLIKKAIELPKEITSLWIGWHKHGNLLSSVGFVSPVSLLCRGIRSRQGKAVSHVFELSLDWDSTTVACGPANLVSVLHTQNSGLWNSNPPHRLLFCSVDMIKTVASAIMGVINSKITAWCNAETWLLHFKAGWMNISYTSRLPWDSGNQHRRNFEPLASFDTFFEFGRL